TTAGEKMSKSTGNSLLVADVVRRVRPVELRYYLLAVHYRSPIEYSEESLAADAAAFRRIEGFVQRAAEVTTSVEPAAKVPEAFAAAMNDDLSVPQALAVLFEAVREGNALLASGDRIELRSTLASVRAMLGVFGVDPLAEPWIGLDSVGSAGDRLRGVVDTLVNALLDERQQARERKDFATADTLRDRLKAAGIVVEDNTAGTRWELADQSTDPEGAL
ncbi:MAG: CysS/YqeB C-terminal domain-containing protein, partial [Jiangellaceae bacterium]